MKNLFKLSLITLLIFLASCARQKENNPKYAANLEIAKSFMLAHGTEDIAAQSAMIHDDLEWHMSGILQNLKKIDNKSNF